MLGLRGRGYSCGVATAEGPDIALLPAASGGDSQLMAVLNDLINEVYAVAEAGLWGPGAARTTIARIAEVARGGELAVARLNGQVTGCIRIRLLGEGVGEFGLLAVAPARRGTGMGRDLVRFAEEAVRAQSCHTMQLEVLVPRDWSHPSKDFLIAWYTRAGYRQVRVGAVEESYPELAPLLATPCDFVIYRKPLAAAES